MSNENQQTAIPSPPIPKNILEYVRNIGPGFIFLLSILGVGDLTGASVNGSKFGYAIIWTLLLAVIARFMVVEAIGRFGLCNPEKLSPIQALVKLYGKWFRVLIAIFVVCFFFTNMSAYVKGCAEILNAMFPFMPVSAWGLVTIAFGIFCVYSPTYKFIEKMFKGLMVVVFLTIVAAAVIVQPDWGAFFKGMFIPSIPPGVPDLRATMFVVVGAIGTVIGGVGQLMYPYFIKQKGWNAPSYIKMVRFDLAFTVLFLFLIDSLLYIPAVTLIHEQEGAVIQTAMDIFNMMHMAIGAAATFVFMIGIFGAAITSVVGMPYGVLHVFQEAVIGRVDQKHLTWKIGATVGWIPPAIAVFTNIPFTTISLLGGNINLFFSLFVGTGILIIGNKKSMIGEKYRNPWWSNLGLGVAFACLWYLMGMRLIELVQSFL
ncbi:MAG: Nramp family divalent metal transporter [Gracilibacteraceae bacterium]|jgi:Mn2+/Fe2+ NRAMP family transporter|nr:Nramp family divalent metal transporter [Gracilibacteraceae bacterium]